MGTHDKDLEVRDPNDPEIDPIGPPTLPKACLHTARALALTGVVITSALALGDNTNTATWPWPITNLVR
jgi:hypothetical protein